MKQLITNITFAFISVMFIGIVKDVSMYDHSLKKSFKKCLVFALIAEVLIIIGYP